MNAPLQLSAAGPGLEAITASLSGFLSQVDDVGLQFLALSSETAPGALGVVLQEAVTRERLRRAARHAPKPKREVPDALRDFGEIVHARGVQACRDARLPYPKDEEEITRG